MASRSTLITRRRTREGRWATVAAWLLLVLPMACGCEIRDLTEPADSPAVPSVPDAPDAPVDDPDPGSQMAVAPGVDYSLPGWVEPEDFAGYVDHPDYQSNTVGSAYRNWWTSWADLEPVRGEYNWDLVEQRLDQAAAGGYRLCPQLRNLVCGGGNEDRNVVIPSSVPEWVFEEFELTEDDIMSLGGDWNIRVIPAWRTDIREAFHDFVRAFGERGYPAREELGAMYIHGVSPSRGEEFWLEPEQTALLERDGGFSAIVMQEWIESRLDAHAEAFGANTHKLAWVGKLTIWKYSGQDYEDAAWNVVQHAWDLGIGNRSSIVEKYHISLVEPALGQSLDDDGYLHTDESIPPLRDGLYFGDENEEYGDDWAWRYGDAADDWQRYRFAMLRTLQMQMRVLWTRAQAEDIDPELSTYARYSLGKTVTSTADAWAYLKESAVRSSLTPARAVKNFERWLQQRDVPGGMTVPVARFDRAFNAGGISDNRDGAFYDFTARRTDADSDQPFMYFDLDDRFTTSGDIDIKVEIIDDTTATWRLEYVGAGGNLVSTESYTGAGDGEVRTVTFTLDDARFAGELDHGMDFRIVCNGPQDVTVRWVRVVRQSRP